MKYGIALTMVAAMGLSAPAAFAGSQRCDDRNDDCEWVYLNDKGLSKAWSYDFNGGGFEITATATADGSPTKVTQGPLGLGVKSDGVWIFPDQLTLDGLGQKEKLYLNFGENVVLKKVLFGRTDPFLNGDQAKLKNETTGDSIVLDLNSLIVDIADLGGYDEAKRTGSLFSFTTKDKSDNYRVKAVQVCEVEEIPTPAAAGGGLALLAGLMVRRRRRLA